MPPLIRLVLIVAGQSLRALLRRGRLLLARPLDRRLVAHAITVRRPDERRKQRLGRERLGLVLGVELAAQEPRVDVARQLDHLDEAAVLRDAAEDQPRRFELRAELGVELVAVAVALADGRGAAVDL